MADVFDALISRRPYKKALPLDQVLSILEEGRGSHFDEVVLEAFLSILGDVAPIAQQTDGVAAQTIAEALILRYFGVDRVLAA